MSLGLVLGALFLGFSEEGGSDTADFGALQLFVEDEVEGGGGMEVLEEVELEEKGQSRDQWPGLPHL